MPAVQAEAVRGVVNRMHAGAGGTNAPAARYLAGVYLCSRGFLADAAEEFSALARLTPESPAPHQALADIYRKVGLPDLAKTAYEEAKALAQAR